jgi:hypothetical protein
LEEPHNTVNFIPKHLTFCKVRNLSSLWLSTCDFLYFFCIPTLHNWVAGSVETMRISTWVLLFECRLIDLDSYMFKMPLDISSGIFNLGVIPILTG